MSGRPKTHRERAEAAVERIRIPQGLSTEPGKTTADMIAREMYPTELAEAAKGLMDEVESSPRHSGIMTLVYLDKVRAALALYPEAL